MIGCKQLQKKLIMRKNEEEKEMEMTYDGTLVMPSNFAVMDGTEMEYLSGGKVVTMNRVPYNTAKTYLIGMQLQCRAGAIVAGLNGIMSSAIPVANYLIGATNLVTASCLWGWADAYGNALNTLGEISQSKKINITERTSGLTLSVSVVGV